LLGKSTTDRPLHSRGAPSPDTRGSHCFDLERAASPPHLIPNLFMIVIRAGHSGLNIRLGPVEGISQTSIGAQGAMQ
jgi:hypothetical protein